MKHILQTHIIDNKGYKFTCSNCMYVVPGTFLMESWTESRAKTFIEEEYVTFMTTCEEVLMDKILA